MIRTSCMRLPVPCSGSHGAESRYVFLGSVPPKLVDEGEPEQLSIFDIEIPKEPDEKHKKLKKALDELNSRYGSGAVVKASLMKRPGTKNTEK